jgi:hypothetical protein
MEFKRFLKRGLLFSLPLLVWALLVVAVDPFNYFNVSRIFPDDVKEANAGKLNSLIFNMLQEKHHPCENVLIGDSRAGALPLERIEKLTGRDYFRLSANALKMNESIDLFYFANRMLPLKRVVFTINFNQFNEYAYADRVTGVEAMLKNPFIYLFDRNVAEAGWIVAKAQYSRHAEVNSVPPMTENEFWDYIVNVRAREHYERFKHPDGLLKKMQDMAAFAKEHGIEVTIIIVPHHQDFQRRVREFKLVDEYLRFKQELGGLGVRVVDYDYLNDLTSVRENFRDPLHYSVEVGNLIADEVFRGPLVKGRLVDAVWMKDCAAYLF